MRDVECIQPRFDKEVVPCFVKLRAANLKKAKKIAKGLDGSAKGIRNTISKFSNSTAIGSDIVHLKRVASLPDVALEDLGKIFKQRVATLTVPGQELLNILTLLGKKLGGSRTIAIMASIYRAFMKHSGLTIREWDVKEGHHWDSALAGSSSLRAAVLRALQSENGEARGDHVAHQLWDMQKFYDSVDFTLLIDELLRRGFPSHLMVLGFLAHCAPRILRVGKSFGPTVVDCRNSMLAGCQLSVSFTRGLLWQLVADLSVIDPEYPCSSHVDDLSQVFVAERKNRPREKIIRGRAKSWKRS